MNTFTLYVQSAQQCVQFENVISFVGRDSSGSLGLMSQHERYITLLETGLCRFRQEGAAWQYLALMEGILYFNADACHISTTQFVIGEDSKTMMQAIKQLLLEDKEMLSQLKQSVNTLEQETFRRLWDIQHREGSGLG